MNKLEITMEDNGDIIVELFEDGEIMHMNDAEELLTICLEALGEVHEYVSNKRY